MNRAERHQSRPVHGDHSGRLRWLSRATKDSGDSVQPLTNALKAAPTLRSKLAYIHALGELGPEGRPALEQLRTLAKDNEMEVRNAAKDAVAAIEAVP